MWHTLWTMFVQDVKGYLQAESLRSLVTVGVLLASFVFSKWINRQIMRKNESVEQKRKQRVFYKNLIWLGCYITILAIWAVKLAGAVLSLAAVLGAVLIVSKEVIMCFYGYWVITFTKPFQIGDQILVNGISGIVVDYNAFSTTLADTDVSSQMTGKNIAVPNSFFISFPCTNASTTGDFTIDMVRIAVPIGMHVGMATECARQAAVSATQQWLEQANAYLENIENRRQIDLPSARPKVLWESGAEGKFNIVAVRFTCPKKDKVDCGQAIFVGFWDLVNKRTGTTPE